MLRIRTYCSAANTLLRNRALRGHLNLCCLNLDLNFLHLILNHRHQRYCTRHQSCSTSQVVLVQDMEGFISRNKCCQNHDWTNNISCWFGENSSATITEMTGFTRLMWHITYETLSCHNKTDILFFKKSPIKIWRDSIPGTNVVRIMIEQTT